MLEDQKTPFRTQVKQQIKQIVFPYSVSEQPVQNIVQDTNQLFQLRVFLSPVLMFYHATRLEKITTASLGRPGLNEPCKTFAQDTTDLLLLGVFSSPVVFFYHVVGDVVNHIKTHSVPNFLPETAFQNVVVVFPTEHNVIAGSVFRAGSVRRYLGKEIIWKYRDKEFIWNLRIHEPICK